MLPRRWHSHFGVPSVRVPFHGLMRDEMVRDHGRMLLESVSLLGWKRRRTVLFLEIGIEFIGREGLVSRSSHGRSSI